MLYFRGGSRAAATSTIERFVIIVNSFQLPPSWMLQWPKIRLCNLWVIEYQIPLGHTASTKG